MTYVLRRLALLGPVLVGISLLAFLLGALAPGDPAFALFELRYDRQPASETELETLRREIGLDGPLPLQYVRWAAGALRGDLGDSYRTGAPVVDELAERVLTSARLAISGLAVSLLIGLPLGLIAAVRYNTWLDTLVRLGGLAGASLPIFWLGYMLLLIFSVYLRWFPVAGSSTIAHWVLPSVALGMSGAAVVARLLRSAMLDVLGMDYVRTARAKGVGERRVVIRHALRNAMIPVVTVMGLLFGHLLGGAVIAEVVFSWPGIGQLIVDAIALRDYPVIRGFVLYTGVVFVLINLLIDLSYGVIDPRVRLGSRGGEAA